MIEAAPSIWYGKAARLEQNRRLLLDAWRALDALDLGLDDAGDRIMDLAELRAVFGRIGDRLTRLNDAQQECIDAGGGDCGFLLAIDRRGHYRLGLRRAPLLSGVLIDRAQEAAEGEGLSLRAWLEGIMLHRLAYGGISDIDAHGGVTRIREYLREGPAKRCQIQEALGIGAGYLTSALGRLKRRGLADCLPGYLWVSLEVRY